MAAKKAMRKDLADFNFGDAFTGGSPDFSEFDNFAPGAMGDPSAYGLGDYNPIPQTPPDFGSDNGAGSIAPGDSAQGGGGIDPGSGTIPFDQASFTRLLQQFGGGTGAGSTLSQIARQLGLSNGAGLGGLAGGLLPILASLYAGNRSQHATEAATAQARADLANTQSQIGGILGGAGSGFKPYADAGANALTQMQAMPPSNLAGNFRPLGSGKGLNLAQIVKG